MSSEAELIYETKRALLEWGINKGLNAEHGNFHAKVIKRCLDCYRGNSTGAKSTDDDQRLSKKEFPKDVESAIRKVFHLMYANPIDNCFLIEDSLLDKCQDNDICNAIDCFPPYHVPYDHYWQKNSKDSHYKMRKTLKQGFSSFKQEDLDPFNRFVSEPTSPEKYYFVDFEDENIIAGNAFEAIVAFHSINNEACMSCKMRKSFCWDGGIGSSWKDIFCFVCGSTYEVKSKASSQHIAKAFQFNSVYGGSFSSFHEMKHLKTKGTSSSNERKHYIVMVSRKSTILKSKNEAVWPVHIAEIDTVLPKLSECSFTSGKYVRISSKVRMKQKTRQLWFNIPVSRCDYYAIAKEVYDKFFPGAWECFTKEREEGSSNEVKYSDEGKETEEPIPTVEDLRGELEKLKTGGSDDDWENCYDSD